MTALRGGKDVGSGAVLEQILDTLNTLAAKRLQRNEDDERVLDALLDREVLEADGRAGACGPGDEQRVRRGAKPSRQMRRAHELAIGC